MRVNLPFSKENPMKSEGKLRSEERKVFELLNKAIISNPFDVARVDTLKQILDILRVKINSYPVLFDDVYTEIKRMIKNLEQRGLKRIQDFSKEDSQLMERAFLFNVFHLNIPDFDNLIKTQQQLGTTPADVPFAKKVLSQMESYGVSKEKSLHYFALSYQLRRAFYFIHLSLVGDSPSMKNLRLALWNNVFTYDIQAYDEALWDRMEDFATILEGETGTGKGTAAAAVGRSAFIPFDPQKNLFVRNFTETFIAINLSQFPESLIESELFGHRKGAFTGAVDNHIGLFERCSKHGALFLDEIGDINMATQIKLLQVIQDRIFEPVGSHTQKRFAGRVIAATNRPIIELRRQGKFRDDFFYRLCSDVITVPTLRQRIEENPSELDQMVDLLVTRMTGKDNNHRTDMILETLKQDLPKDYPWPGNVRELEQAVRSILLKRHYYGDAMVTDIDMEDSFIQDFHMGTLDAKELLNQYCHILYKRYGTYEEVARKAQLDPRTVKKYLNHKAK
jgi:sigma-54 specific flagellar transcriptional regulator A